MSKANPHYQKIIREYIFPIIDQKLLEMQKKHPSSKVLNFGVGDVVHPLKPTITEALVKASNEMGSHVIGYGPSTGYPFLKKAIVDAEYGKYGILESEVFISDGTIGDSCNLLEIFDEEITVAIPDPTYPSYLDATVMSGRTKPAKKNGDFPGVLYLPCTAETGFKPMPPSKPCDVIYLCSPNNPTGVALTKDDYKKWIAYAKEHQAIIILDAAYECFIRSPDVPRSIYEIPGAKEVAIELRTFSKFAGFTGLRCAYSIVPKALKANIHKDQISLNEYWNRRQNVKTNGVSYPIQRAAEAALSKKAQEEVSLDIKDYATQTKKLKEAISSQGYTCFGGEDSPYIWWQCPEGQTSMDFFEFLLNELQILTIPGTGFGHRGEGFIRLSGFTHPKDANLAISRLKKL